MPYSAPGGSHSDRREREFGVYTVLSLSLYTHTHTERLVSFRNDLIPNPSTQIQPYDIRMQDLSR